MLLKYVAPAKINLSLHITNKRPNGYHELSSLVVFTEFGDLIELKPAMHLMFNIQGPFAKDLPYPKQNSMIIAAQKAAKLFQKKLNVEITLTKNLPISSGIGGGTSDAATLLKMLLNFWQIKTLPENWPEFLLNLGADIPVCFFQKPCLMSGIGEHLEPFHLPFNIPILLINPLKSISTIEAFKTRKEVFSEPCQLPQPENLASFITSLKPMQNDLTHAAQIICIEVKSILEALQSDPNCHLARMSGSGATCFGLYSSIEDAKKAAENFKLIFPNFWIQPTSINII
ncbi:MAG: 4-(cytidine 5'-diphospho)-2-C-methyl-D-erythritol kinase [Alphaproteobacteria bacterium]|nr:4-(cytidine 5'-diphospho)-2-C-methyl-D-erythritol kinase [Alphaproteobacteria bacterium]